MNIQNLALIFTPVIFHDFNQTDDNSVGDWSPDDLFEDLILNFELLFPISEESARKNNEHKLTQALHGKSPYSQFSQSNLLYLSNPILATSTPITTNNMLLTQPMNPAMLMNNGADSPGGPNSTDQQYSSPYPPNLTTIIGTAPPGNISSQNPQRLASHPQQPYNSGPIRSVHPVDTSARIVPPRYQSDAVNPSYQQQQQMAIQRSTSETTAMQRGSSMNNASTPDNVNNGNYGYNGPGSNSSNNSPLPARMNNEPVHTLTKRNSSIPLQQKNPYAPPRQDSLRKVQSRFPGDTGEKPYSTTAEQADQPISATLSGKQQHVPHPIITTNTSQHQYYQPELNQDYMLPSVSEINLDSLIDYYSPVTNERPELKTQPK